MSVPKTTKRLSSLFNSVLKSTSSSSSPNKPHAKCLIKFPNDKNNKPIKHLSDAFDLLPPSSNSISSENDLPQATVVTISDTLSSSDNLPDSSSVNKLDGRWVQNLSPDNLTIRQKLISRDRKKRWEFKESRSLCFNNLVKTCAEKVGTDVTLYVFDKLGPENTLNDCNDLIRLCIEESKKAENEEVILKQIHKVYQLLMKMREHGFQLEEETYGQCLSYLIDMQMVDNFNLFCGIIREENRNSLPRLAYYDMLLWVRLGDEDKIRERCDFVATDDVADKSTIREGYVLALCESERRKELLILLDVIDITKHSSINYLNTIFKSLARLSLETYAKKFTLALKSCDTNPEIVSKLISEYAVSIPNIEVEDATSKSKLLHEEWGVTFASASCEKLVERCCNLSKVHAALNIIDYTFEVGLTLPIKSFHLILQTCDESCDYNLVHRIYSVIRLNKVEPGNETFRIMINLSLRMKDFEGAYNMLRDMEEMNIIPKTNIYNTLMAAHFREKNSQAALQVFKEMERAGVKPDSHTFSYLIGNSNREEDITKYYERVKLSGVAPTKHVFMALINAYASCGQIEKAKQVVFEKTIPTKIIKEVKSVLVSTLACNGHVSDSLSMYEEIKKDLCHADPKTIICLIENLRSEKYLSKLLELLEDIKDTDYWTEGCCRILVYGVQHKDLRFTVDLMKQLKDKFYDDDIATEVLFDEAFCKIAETEQVDLHFGLDLLKSVKEELSVRPSRQSLDFLLSACIRAKDSKTARLIWKEYKAAGLPYNVLSYIRMFRVFIACGDEGSAKEMKHRIPSHDPHIHCVMKACRTAYDDIPEKTKKVKSSLRIELTEGENLAVEKVEGLAEKSSYKKNKMK